MGFGSGFGCATGVGSGFGLATGGGLGCSRAILRFKTTMALSRRMRGVAIPLRGSVIFCPVSRKALVICHRLALGTIDLRTAKAPATCAAAIDVSCMIQAGLDSALA